MAFKLPTLNITYHLWRAYDIQAKGLPPRIPPDTSDLPCQLRSTLTGLQVVGDLDTARISELLLTTKGADLRPAQPGVPADLVECPAGTGRLYVVVQIADMHKGFPNEYRVARIASQWAVPGGWRYPTP